jgi:two-component system sensor histidine kinase HupT/HoxJ
MAEIKRAYRQLHEAHEALKRTQQQLLHAEKMSSLGRLVAGVAHELNNPISFVLGNVHVLNRYTTRLRQYLDAIHAQRLL